MGLRITLQDESGNVIDEALDGQYFLYPFINEGVKLDFKCLPYIDPYGDTVFNRGQMKPLLMELESLHHLASTPLRLELIAKLEEMCKRCQGEPHLYIKFWGD